jgi:hypothetical protein
MHIFKKTEFMSLFRLFTYDIHFKHTVNKLTDNALCYLFTQKEMVMDLAAKLIFCTFKMQHCSAWCHIDALDPICVSGTGCSHTEHTLRLIDAPTYATVLRLYYSVIMKVRHPNVS